MGGSKKVTVGYRYYVGMHMILCHGPVDRVLNVSVDDRDVWSGSRSGGQISINRPDVFGGDSREGGIQGAVDFETGHAGQGQNLYLLSKLGAIVPAFRGVVGVVLRQVYMGLNPYLKKWAFRVQRIHLRQNGLQQWYDSKAEIRAPGKFKQSQAILLCIDTSGSMNDVVFGSTTRLQLVKQQLVDIVEQINILRKDSAVTVHLGICAFDTSTNAQTYNNANDASFAAAKAFINGLSASGSTNFGPVFAFANSWFGTNVNHGNRADTMVLITDGLPDPIGNFPTALSTGANIINQTGPFSGNAAIDLYAINVDLSDTTYTQQMDNTPWDGVPVINSTDTSALYNAVFFAIAGNNSSMNPAHIIRECLTDPLWGMGYPDSDIDDTSFMAAADTLHAEQFGMSLLWDTETSIEEFIKIIVKHIDASVYVDRKTGKFILKLIRDDYNPVGLLVLNESNVEKISDYKRPSIGELVNSVTVTYWSSDTGENATLTVQDIALSQQQQSTVGTSINYEGIASPYIASRVAQRDLKTLSTPLASCTIYANRVAAGLNVGDVFRLTWPDYDLVDVVMRVTGIAYGDGRSHRVRIQCVEDVFSMPDSAVIVPPSTEWEDPKQDPMPITRRVVFEVPYLELVQQQGQQAIDALLAGNADMGFVGAGAASPQSGALSARIYTDMGNGYTDASNLDFCPSAVLDEDIDQMAATLLIRDVQDIDNIILGTWFQVGAELMSVEAITTSSITVKRGVLDTVPVPHSAGDDLVFWDAYGSADPTEYVAGEQIDIKLLTVTGAGRLALTAAPQDSVTLSSRVFRPYPPAQFRINNEFFPVAPLADISLSWVHRNRIQQTGSVLLGFEDSGVTPEAGTTYTVRLADGTTGLVFYTKTGIAGTDFIVPAEDIPPETESAYIRLYAVRDGYESYRFHDFLVNLIRNIGDNLMFDMNEFQMTPPSGDALDFMMDD